MVEFVWTDELVEEFAEKCFKDNADIFTPLRIRVSREVFKASKQPKKDWEIVAFRNASMIDCILNRGANGYFQRASHHGGSQESTLLGMPNMQIHSVRRLSDGEVFTVGDSVQCKTQYPNPILAFDIYQHPDKGEILRVVTHCYNPPDDRQYNDITEVQKRKQPLFTTEDGVDIYEGGKVWVVFSDFSFGEYDLKLLGNDMMFKLWVTDVARRPFSTEAAAKKYVKMNKPCLSVNDIAKLESEWKNSLCFRSFFDYLSQQVSTLKLYPAQ